jgi:hypothetical protein
LMKRTQCRVSILFANSGSAKNCLGGHFFFFAHFYSRLHSDFIRLLFLQTHGETDLFFAASGVQSAQSNLGATYFHFRRATFLNQFKSKCGLLLVKTAPLRVTLNLDGAPIVSNSHTHPSHSQTSWLLTSSLSLGVPSPRPTQCMRDV